jgi:energy-coupling factor transporter ATP-binding protein EcfA2
MRSQHIHEGNCYWAEEFAMKYDIDLPDNVDEQIKLCCCCPEITHDETMKLQLLFKNDKITGNQPILDKLIPGRIKQTKKAFFGENKFHDCETTGKNRIIHSIFNAFSIEGARVIYLVGEPGSGKSMLSKHIANYMTERHKVSNAQYLNMDKVSNIAVLMANIPDYRIMISFDNYKGKSAGQETLIILDNMDEIIKNHFRDFKANIQEMLEQTKLKFLVICSNSTWIQNSNNQWQEKVFVVPPLNMQAAAKLLLSMARDHLPFNLRNIVNLQSHPVFKPNPTGFTLKPTPKIIAEIAFLLKKGQNLDRIYEDYCVRENTKGSQIESESLKQRKAYIE